MKLRAIRGGLYSFALLCFVLAGCRKPGQRGGSETSRTANPPAQQSLQPASQRQGATCSFEWIDSKKQAGIWAEVSNAFRQELLPDKQNGDSSQGVYTIKRIARVARCGDAMMVVLEKRTDQKESDEWDRPFELYNLNLARNEKSPFTAKWTFWAWQFDRLARFEDGPAPDIIFESESCSECEPEIILSALRFDPKEQKWELRRWPKGDEGIQVADAAVGIDGSVEEYETLSGIADFDGKGYDEVAVWTHYRDVGDKDPGKAPGAVTTLRLYGFQNGTPVETEVKEQSEVARIKKQLREANAKSSAGLLPEK